MRSSAGGPPGILVVHADQNDLDRISMYDLIGAMQEAYAKCWELCPNLVVISSGKQG